MAFFMVDYFKYFEKNIATQAIYPKLNNPVILIKQDQNLIKYRLNKGFFNDIYLKWFSNELNNHTIKPEIMETISSFTTYFNEHYNVIFQFMELKEFSIAHYDKLHILMQKLSLFDVKFEYEEHYQPENNYRIIVLIAIIKKTLDFSGQKLESIDNLYDSLCKPKP